CRTKGATGVTRGRLDPDIAEAAFAQHLAVGDAVKRHAASKTQVLHSGLGREAAGEAQDNVLQYRLDRRRNVHMLLLEPGLGIAWRRTEQRVEALVRHR